MSVISGTMEEYRRITKLLKGLHLGEETKCKQRGLLEDSCKTIHCHIQNKIKVTSLLHEKVQFPKSSYRKCGLTV